MARRINALQRNALQKGLRDATKDAERLTRAISGADEEPVKRAAFALRKAWRRVLSTPGGGEPSAPGSAPHKQGVGFRFRRRKGSAGPARFSRPLFRSIGTAVVEGVRRVGSGDFRARLHEFGAEDHPPRPHARVALEAAAGKMADVIVTASQQEIATATLPGGA